MNLLVIDDDNVDRLMVRDLLGPRFRFFEAKSRPEVNSVLESSTIDCVLLDYLIPGTDSIQLLRDIAGRQIPVIIMTGEGSEDVAVTAMKHGAQDYINKRDLNAELLAKTITSAFDTVKLKRRLDEKQEELSVAHDTLKRKVEELEKITRDLESFVHIASHDLREPLRNLSMYCDLLERDLGSSATPSIREYLEAMRRGSKRLSLLIDDLRSLGRIGYVDVKPEAVLLDKVVDQVLADLSDLLAKRAVEIQRDPLPQVMGYPSLLVELYRNLLSNALKYGSEDELRIGLTAENGGGQWVFGVRNTGIPLSDEEGERVFHPFYRLPAARKKEGTGMGLTICRKIVEHHGGVIWVESPEAGWVHFRYTLGKMDVR